MNKDPLSDLLLSESLQEHRVMVFLVDDQAFIGEAVRRQLSDRVDIDFHYCPDGREAVQLASEIKPTVILQDLVMPNVDGLDLVRQFRQTPETKNIPILVLSAREDAEVKSEAFSAGANDYLVKLPDKVEMIARIYYHSRAYLSRIERDAAYGALRKSQRQLVDSNMELTQLSEKLRQNNEALQAAERLARFGSWSWDIEKNEALWSDALYAMFLRDPSQLAPQGEELKTIFTPESFTLFTEAAEQCAKRGKPYSLELEGIRGNGEHFFFNAKGQPSRDPSGRLVSLFGTIHDITEQRKLGEVAQRAAVLEERARIAGEIHDSLAQSFAAIVLQTEIAEERFREPGFAGPLENIVKVGELARFGLAEARRSALTLHPSHALQEGLVHAVKQLFQRTSIKEVFVCEAKTQGIPRRLDPLVEHELFRIAQEALNNAVRHAASKRMTSLLHFEAKSVTMTLEDDGIGFTPPTKGTEGLGLRTMRERAKKAGASFSIEGKPGKGTRITVKVSDRPSSIKASS